MKNYFLRKFLHISLISLIITIFVSIVSAQSMFRKVLDFDGNGKADKASLNPDNNFVTLSNAIQDTPTRSIHFGLPEDSYIPADFDGDGIGDLTVWRNSDGNWYWLRSSDNVFQIEHWGLSGDIPTPADYDGDGKTDRAVYRPGSPNGIYYVSGSLSGFRALAWGIPGDRVVLY